MWSVACTHSLVGVVSSTVPDVYFKNNRMHEHEFERVLLEAIHLVDDEMDFILAAPVLF